MSAGFLGGKIGVIVAGSFATAGTVFALSAYVYTEAGGLHGATSAVAVMSRPALSGGPAGRIAEVSVDWDQVEVIRSGFEPIALTTNEVKERSVLPARHSSAGVRARPVAPPLLVSRAERGARTRGYRQGLVRPGPTEGVPERVAFDSASEAASDDMDDEESGLPERPRREQVARTMATIRRGVQRCFDLKMVPGEVVLHLTVAGSSGRVIHTRTSEATGTATCIGGLSRRLRFPLFARERVTIRYTYNLR
jgi:hypothetical protein